MFFFVCLFFEGCKGTVVMGTTSRSQELVLELWGLSLGHQAW